MSVCGKMGRREMGQGSPMLCQLGQAGKSDCGNVVPLENRQGVDTEGARYRETLVFLAPHSEARLRSESL